MATFKSLRTGKKYRVNNGKVEYKVNGNWYSSASYSEASLKDPSKFSKIG